MRTGDVDGAEDGDEAVPGVGPATLDGSPAAGGCARARKAGHSVPGWRGSRLEDDEAAAPGIFLMDQIQAGCRLHVSTDDNMLQKVAETRLHRALVLRFNF